MRKQIDNCWVEYRDSIDLMDCPSDMEIGLCWYKNGTKNKWTNHFLVDLETIIALASMTYIVDFDV